MSSSELVADCRCVCHFLPDIDKEPSCDCCEWGNEKWVKLDEQDY